MRWREPVEWLVLAVAAAAFMVVGASADATLKSRLLIGVAVWAAVKTGYYFAENLKHLQDATSTDLAYHKFVLLLAYNMAQITISFALDFYCLVQIDRGSLNGIDPELVGGELLFECFYFSVLNFSFFGYGDITPAHIPGVIMLLEVVTAFSTVIFLLSDFVSMKESMRRKNPPGPVA